ncbi:MAG: DNA mismatch repair endonuclease MutL [Euryarchaeota archaeon]|nr:DNA mismatch repair endonuclease MutL [Euryarchaeota archaeon]
MPRIRVLSESVASRIAAGEVVERPASVVKELVENSLDAEAGRIVIEIRDGGKSYIRVSDDGVGMSREDARLAFERHATSKISSFSDLYAVRTLGFRGEALPSIASVARVTMETRERGSLEGTRIVVEGGEVLSLEASGCAFGTSVVVERLFFNTPARRKFLKSAAAEGSAVVATLTRYLLAFPEVHFEFFREGRRSIVAPRAGLRGRLAQLYGRSTAEQLRKLELERGGYRIHGFVSPPSLTRASRAEQYLFVNRRYVRSSLLRDALAEAYHTLLPKHRHPLAFIFLELPPERVDVNVHPAKIEVKFKEEEKLRSLLVEAISEALHQRSPAKPEPRQLSLEVERAPVRGVVKEAKPEYGSERKAGARALFFRQLRPLGQLHNTYILAESSSGLVLIDQHAAHERVLFERFKAQLERRELEKQQLVSPALIELSPREAAVLEENLSFIADLGFEVEKFGERSYLVKAVPLFLGSAVGAEEVREVLHSLIEVGSLGDVERRREEMIYRVACKNAVKAGDYLSMEEMRSLLAHLSRTSRPETCPHGRPTMVTLGLEEIERRFSRR